MSPHVLITENTTYCTDFEGVEVAAARVRDQPLRRRVLGNPERGGMKRMGRLLIGAVILASLAGCGEEPTIEERAAEAETCRESGGSYVFERPSGYASAFYHCIWDTREAKS